MTARLAAVDWLRAIGIFLIVYGHSGAVPVLVNWVIFAFHVPLFFFLSGFLTRKTRIDHPFLDYAKDVLRSLVPAYLFFAVLGFVAWYVVLRHYGEGDLVPVSPWRHFAAIFYGSGSRDDLLFPIVLWFFPCLVVARLLLWPLTRLGPWWRLAAAAGFAALAIPTGRLVLPWEIESALCAVVFVLAGHELAQHRRWSGRLLDSPWYVGAALLLAGVGLALVNARVDLRLSIFGNPVLYYLAALACTLGLFRIFAHAKVPRTVERVSMATLFIFPLHPFVFSGFAALYAFVLHVPLSVAHIWWVGIAVSLAAVVIITAVSPLIRPIIDVISGVVRRRNPEAGSRARGDALPAVFVRRGPRT